MPVPSRTHVRRDNVVDEVEIVVAEYVAVVEELEVLLLDQPLYGRRHPMCGMIKVHQSRKSLSAVVQTDTNLSYT